MTFDTAEAMSSSLSNVKIAFDASAIIGFFNPDVNILKIVIDYFVSAGYKMVMSETNFFECSSAEARGMLRATPCFEMNQTDQEMFTNVKRKCKNANIQVQDMDYKGIASAVDLDCYALVSNDAKLIEATAYYSKSERKSLRAWTPANFIYFMYRRSQGPFPNESEC